MRHDINMRQVLTISVLAAHIYDRPQSLMTYINQHNKGNEINKRNFRKVC